MKFTATSLEDIAKAMEHCAWQATAFSDRLHKTQRSKLLAEREASTWKRAAAMLRETAMAPAAAPAMLAALAEIQSIKDDCPPGAEMDGETASQMAEIARAAIAAATGDPIPSAPTAGD